MQQQADQQKNKKTPTRHEPAIAARHKKPIHGDGGQTRAEALLFNLFRHSNEIAANMRTWDEMARQFPPDEAGRKEPPRPIRTLQEPVLTWRKRSNLGARHCRDNAIFGVKYYFNLEKMINVAGVQKVSASIMTPFAAA